MKKTTLSLLPILAITSLTATAAHADIFGLGDHDDDIENAKKAQITIVEAINKATEAYDGFVITATLEEKEDDALVYEIDLVQEDKEMEVWVDAKTGKVSELMDD